MDHWSFCILNVLSVSAPMRRPPVTVGTIRGFMMNSLRVGTPVGLVPMRATTMAVYWLLVVVAELYPEIVAG